MPAWCRRGDLCAERGVITVIEPGEPPQPPKPTPLDALHRALGARMVTFAGYSMPLQYGAGIIAEHQQCRQRAALFDVSHMGQAVLHGATAPAALERLVPSEIIDLPLTIEDNPLQQMVESGELKADPAQAG